MKPGLLRDETRKAKALERAEGIVTGFDLYDDGELDKQRARAARFGTSEPVEPAITFAQPGEEVAARAARAAKFGLTYEPPDPAGERSLLRVVM